VLQLSPAFDGDGTPLLMNSSQRQRASSGHAADGQDSAATLQQSRRDPAVLTATDLAASSIRRGRRDSDLVYVMELELNYVFCTLTQRL